LGAKRGATKCAVGEPCMDGEFSVLVLAGAEH
jgi:hypothetical protein